jgi:nucleoside 2-deoxyribosyltransferase
MKADALDVDTDVDTDTGKPVYYVYLAGPEVFLPEPIAAGAAKKARIAALSRAADWPFELAGLYPLDNEIPDSRPDFDTGMRIYRANIALMDRAYAVAANMVRFRGPSMDVGTAFEMGYMRGLGKPVFAYYDAAPFYGREEAPGLYVDRVREHGSVSAHDARVDADGHAIDDFQMADNLMMVGALESGAGAIAGYFDEAVMQIAQSLLKLKAADSHPRSEGPLHV